MTSFDSHSVLPQAIATNISTFHCIPSQPATASTSEHTTSLTQKTPAPRSTPASNYYSQPHWRARWFRPAVIYLGLIATLLSSCNRPSEAPVNLKLHQQWHLQPGQTIASYPISSGLGDVVINLGGKALYMPKAGRIQPLTDRQNEASATGKIGTQSSNCVAVSSPEIPAYRLRLCHLHQLQLGQQPAGQIIGRGEQVAIAMLRKQPEGTWAFVEPSPSLLEALLTQP